MFGRPQPRLLALIAVTAAMSFSAEPACGQMILLEDERVVRSIATYQGVTDTREDFVNMSGTWNSTAEALVEAFESCGDPPPCSIGHASSYSEQISLYFPTAIQFNVTTQGTWSGQPSGSYDFLSKARFKFRVGTPFDAHFFAQVVQGDWSSIGLIRGFVKLTSPAGTHHYVTGGMVSDTTRFGPGTYELEGISWGFNNVVDGWQGATAACQWQIFPIPITFLPYQPSDQTVACGGTAQFTVAPAQPGLTYQWRRNLQPLSNGGNISGATGATLTISGACHADAGYYDVVASDGTISEPSGLAQLTIWTTTGIEEPAGAIGAISFAAPSPNPFGNSTSMRYTVQAPTRVTAAVFNASGARVRSLLDDVRSGTGAITWDGRLRSGAPAPAGIYFMQAAAGGVRETKRVVLLK